MTSDFEGTQREIDALFEERLAPAGAPLERILILAKTGVSQPSSLAAEDVQILCNMLLSQYAQMGIS